ncbi:MAG TPA: glycosyl hydrolase [Acidobacteriaceae bacterium]|jgi:hypothetical protein
MLAETRLQHTRRSRSVALLCAALPCAALSIGSPAVAQQYAGHPQKPAVLSITELRAGFQNPPPESRLRCYWWWLNGQTDKATITHDLEEMKAKGFGGALLVDANGANQTGNNNVPPGPTFGSPAWVELYTHALQEADRLGLEITLNITSGWNLGGPDVTPEQASKLLTWTRTQVTGGETLHLQLPAPTIHNGFYRQIAVLAYPLHNGSALPAQPSGPPLRVRTASAETGFSMPDAAAMLNSSAIQTADAKPEEVQDVSSHVDASGMLTWQAPAGAWEVLRIGYTDSDARVSTSSGAWQGLAIDYMDPNAFQTYWDRDVAPLLLAAKPFHSLKYLATDSWELGGTNWTATFAAEFKRRRGYDPTPWLPVVAGRVLGSSDQSVRFLTDLRRTVADLIVANHYDLFAQRAAEHGLGIQAESGGPHGAPIDALETFRGAAVPQSEFWSQNAHRSRDVERFFTKEAASAANIYGRRFVAQEGETSIGPQWSESLATDLKPSFDMAITEGMNRLVWHQFTSSPAATGLPGQEYFAGTHLNPKVTWWNAGTAFFSYLNRVQFMMQQGTPVDDVLYFYGDHVPNFVRLKGDDPAHVLPDYDYDVTDEDALLHTLHVDHGDLAGPSGVRWSALVLPKTGRLSMAAMQQLESLIRLGANVIGNPPTSPTGRVSQGDLARFEDLKNKIWGEACSEGSSHRYGEGHVFCTEDARQALAELHVLPDVATAVPLARNEIATSNAQFDYAHRRDGNTDIYFFRNGSDTTAHHVVTLRVQNKTARFWDPVTGDIRSASTTAIADGRTQVTLELPPFGSTFLILSGESTRTPTRAPAAFHSAPLIPQGAWSLSFQLNRGAPAAALHLEELKSWSESSDPAVRYFSGTAVYRATVNAPQFKPGEHVLLHFSDVREIARVKINGSDAGTVWAKPLTLRVDHWLKPGRNTLEIAVTNLWPNRIIGDLQPGVTERYTSTNITAYHQDSTLLPSGLIGPVEWLIQQ